jgi:cyclic-di-AMP phosphodiesterase PgpH
MLDRLPDVLRYLLVIGVVAFISILSPDNVKFKYEFEKGQTWRFEDLEAPFDFAIRKPAPEIQAEIQELEKDFSPYYQLDFEVAKEKKQLFESEFNKQLEEFRPEGQFNDVIRQPKKYLDYGKGFLDRIFDRGIVSLAEPHRDKGKNFVINILRGNITQRQTLENLLTVTTAKAVLSDSLPYSELEEPEFVYPLLENVVVPNVFFNDTLTHKLREEMISGVSTSRGMVKKGELIISRDGIVTEEAYQKLISFKEQYEREVAAKRSHLGVFAGYLLLTSLVVGVLLIYLRLFAREIFMRLNKLVFILLWLVVYSYMVYAVESTGTLSAYLIPFCIVPIVVKTFYNERLALFTHIVVVLIASFLSSLGYEFAFLQILAGIVVLLSDVDTHDWSRFFYSILYVFLTYALAYLGLSLIVEGSLASVDWSVYAWIFLNVFLTLLAYPLIPLLERLFGFTSSISLVELSDLNRPLLRELAVKAPGTLQHSLQVGNLSEAAARKIGADPLLVKVAALYHDIGKTLNPEYFIENQGGNNPHSGISNMESARIIIGHVAEGVKKAKKYRLPNVLIDFIQTHHGTTRAEFFYRNYLKENPGKEADENLFSYPGPRPRSKEETILMMADSIEAACKSLKSPTGQELDDFIDKIIAGKITLGQMEDSKMTFRELEDCKEVFKQIMRSVYHVRIEYPEEKAPETKNE